MAKFVAYVTFTENVERRREVRPRHREYLRSLLEAGKLHESGPFTDDRGALIIYEAADAREAQSLIDADPYAGNGVIERIELREWNRVMPPPP